MFMKYCMSVVFSNINVQKKYILPIDREGESLQLAPDFPRPAHILFPDVLTVSPLPAAAGDLLPVFPGSHPWSQAHMM